MTKKRIIGIIPVKRVSSTNKQEMTYFNEPRLITLLCPDFPVTVVKFLRPEVMRWLTIRIRKPKSIIITARILACPARFELIPTY